jgi:predicted small lipoprotein YifL
MLNRCLPLVAACLVLTACGLKGDLYLPPEPAPAPAATPVTGDDPGTADAPATPGKGVPAEEDARRQLPATPDRSEAE